MAAPKSPSSSSPNANDAPAPFHVSRRAFVKRCAIAAAATGLPLWFIERELGAATPTGNRSPNSRPGVVLVGCGGMGKIDTEMAAHWGDIVAVCDVDAHQARSAAEKFAVEGRQPKIYSDFRRALENPDVHTVINATPDHWHTLINYAAVRAGKDVYAEKPLTLAIAEGRHLIAAVRSSKAILQTGTQQRSNARFRLASELVRNGRLGKLKSATVWLPAGLNGGPFPTVPVPAELDWDFWQGQAPATPYVRERCHATFRFWYEYSGGTMTDWGAHHNDIAYWAIGLVAPRFVSSERLSEPVPGGYNTYADYAVNYTYDNGIQLNIRTTRDDSMYGAVINADGQRNGIRFEGSDGWIWVNRDGIQASDPELLKAELPSDAVRLQVSKHHMGNFFECVASRELPICDVEVGHRSANICHLGAISLRTGKSLEWHAEAERFVGENAAEANTYLAREMRAPYDYSFAG